MKIGQHRSRRGVGISTATDRSGDARRHHQVRRSKTRFRAISANALLALVASLALLASLLAVAPAQAVPGGLDPGFSGDGIVLTGFGGEIDAGSAVALQADGRIVIAGTTLGYDERGDYQSDFALARFDADGSPDTSFSGDGNQITHFGAGTVSTAAAVAIQPDGKILLAGSARVSAGQWDFALARYRADGSLDSSFAGDGTVTTGLRGSANSVAIQTDGRIVVAGDSGLARYRPDGSLDTSFGDDGTVITGLGGSAVAIQSDGKIVVAGASQLARYRPDGSLDATFSNDGTLPTNAVWARSVVIQADGRIVVAGAISVAGELPHYDFALLRYTPDGALDTSFGSAGMQTTSFSAGWLEDEIAAAVALQRDGKIVAVGTSTPVDWVWEGSAIVLARYATNGSLDQSFADGGKRVTIHGVDNSGAAVAMQADGKIVVAGSGSDPRDGASRALLARYQADSDSSTAPANSTPPTISGTAAEGQTLTANAGTWSGSTPINHRYQWRRCDTAGAGCVDIAAATATTYALVAADVGHTIRVRETASNAYGAGAVDSATTAVVKARVGAIAGTVRRAGTSAVIAGASVTCGSGYSAGTAGDGTYSIPNVAPGSYRCTATANRYRPSTSTVTVASGQTITANFSLATS
jgi:uncharacterized delta-60 repeat protein